MAEHTRTPWHVSNEEAIKIKDSKGDSLLSMFHTHLRGRRPTDEVEANAAFIVKAVNNHDALVNALKSLANEIHGLWNAFEYGIRFEISNTNYAIVQNKLAEAERILAQLKEQAGAAT